MVAQKKAGKHGIPLRYDSEERALSQKGTGRVIMGIFRQLAHLEEQIGRERFQILINPEYTGKVKAFCDGILDVVSPLPTEMVVGGRTYEILSPPRSQENAIVSSRAMFDWSKTVHADLGAEDCDHILRYQFEIPAVLQDRVDFEFTGMRQKDEVALIAWSGIKWHQGWCDLCYGRDYRVRVLRRKS